jgi:hypothetical protein
MTLAKAGMKMLTKLLLHPFVFYPLLLALVILIQTIYVYLVPFDRTIVVKEKVGYSSGKHLRNTIMDEMGRVYQVSNSVPRLHFRSAEVWMSLEKGKSYHVNGNGLRVSLFGLYPNIVKATPV